MKTQVSILVEKESKMSKVLSIKGFWGLMEKSGVLIYIDSEEAEPVYLEERDEPYTLELEPGRHAILFRNPGEIDKKIIGGVVKIGAALALGAAVSGMGGSFGSNFNRMLDATSGDSVRDGFASFTLQEGDIFRLSCRPTLKGDVKVKALK